MTLQRLGLREREYAAHAGISRGAVQKARASGRLVLHADGSIDAAASDARRAQATDPAMQRGRQRSPLRPVPEAAVGAVSETLREQGLPAPSVPGGMGASADARGVAYLQARTANEVLKAQERKMRVQKLRSELVDRARATALVFRLARQEQDSLSRLAGADRGDDGCRPRHQRPPDADRVGGPCPAAPGRARRDPRRPPLTRGRTSGPASRGSTLL